MLSMTFVIELINIETGMHTEVKIIADTAQQALEQLENDGVFNKYIIEDYFCVI